MTEDNVRLFAVLSEEFGLEEGWEVCKAVRV
jgi:hypothetical protein